MTGKKKLNLGPLPEELDYSKYEQTVTRWDRVIGVVIVGLIVLILLIYMLFSGSKPSSEIALVEQEPVAPMAIELGTNSSEPAETGVTGDPVTEVSATEATETEEQVTEIESKIEMSAEADKPVQTVDTRGMLSSAGVSADQPEDADAMQTAQAEVAVKSPAALAAVNILSPAITQAILSDELAGDEPGTPLAETLILPESGITKVILFTEMRGLLGLTLYHEWYRNGERQARVKVPVNYKEQRSLSSKFINLQMTGDWQVKVVDGKGKAYIDAAFKVIKP